MEIDKQKILIYLLIIAMIAALGVLGYLVAIPKTGDKFSEYYILNAEGKAKDYPYQVVLGKPIDITIGIINHEYEAMCYQVDVTIDNTKNTEISVGELAHKERWQEVVSFTPDKTGDGQKVDFWLYKNGENSPYFKDPLYLFIDVIKP